MRHLSFPSSAWECIHRGSAPEIRGFTVGLEMSQQLYGRQGQEIAASAEPPRNDGRGEVIAAGEGGAFGGVEGHTGCTVGFGAERDFTRSHALRGNAYFRGSATEIHGFTEGLELSQ